MRAPAPANGLVIYVASAAFAADRQSFESQHFLHIPHTKTHKVRDFPITAALKAVLDATPKHTGKVGVSPFVFVNTETEKRFKGSSVSHAFKRAALDANLNDVSFHTLRHTAVSRVAAAGISDRQIMQLIGHSSPQLVARYAHLRAGDLKKAAEVLARASSVEIPIEVGTRMAQTHASKRAAT